MRKANTRDSSLVPSASVARLIWAGIIFAGPTGCGDDAAPQRSECATQFEFVLADDGSISVTTLPQQSGGDRLVCGDDQVCVAKQCVARCMGDTDCGRREICDVETGVCLPSRAAPRPIPGSDAGPVDLCAGIRCDSDPARPVCQGAVGECVACIDSAGCGGTTPICNLAAGRCESFRAGNCAPCNRDLDCGTDPAVTRCMELDPLERVCVPTCSSEDTTCPTGLTCDESLNVCRPNVGTCTQFFSGAQQLGCTTDADCVPLGATPATGICTAEASVNTCHQSCMATADCPEMQTCDSASLCRPPPPPMM